MLGNYLRTAWRNLRRDSIYALINVGGLSLGIACCLVITIWLLQETSYDTFHPSGHQLYRVSEEISRTDGFQRQRGASGMPLGPIAVSEIPEIEAACRVARNRDILSTSTLTSREEVYAADSNFFQMFGFKLAAGDPRHALADPSHIIVSSKMADKYFGRSDVLGERITWNGNPMIVVGVLDKPRGHSHLQFDLLIPIKALEQRWPEWSGHWDAYVYTYVRLRPGTDTLALAQRLSRAAAAHLHQPGTTLSYHLLPVSRLHVYSPVMELTPTVGSGTLLLYGIAAVLILGLACSNYVTLSIARSSRRLREVGMRKVLGGKRIEIFMQFLIESVFVSTLSVAVALSAVELTSPLIGRFLQTDFNADLASPLLWLLACGYAMAVGLAAGMYPALYLARTSAQSSFRPTPAISRLSFGRRGALIVVQFAITALLLMVAVGGHRQIAMLLRANLGFDPTNVLIVPVGELSDSRQSLLKSKLVQLDGVVGIAGCSNIIGGTDCYGLTYRAQGARDEQILPTFWVDEKFPSLLGLHMVGSGSEEASSLQRCFATAPALQTLGISTTEQSEVLIPAARGKQAYLAKVTPIQNLNPRNLYYGTHQSLVLVVDSQNCEYLYVRTNVTPGVQQRVMEQLTGIWSNLSANLPLEAFWLTDYIASGYSRDQRFTWSLTYGALLALLVSAVGLIGFTAYLTAERTKEIGIRRVLGASAHAIVWQFLRRFALLITIAAVPAIPFAWWLTERWLMQFPVRVDSSIPAMILVAILLLLLSLGCIALQALSAARRNPVESLRYE